MCLEKREEKTGSLNKSIFDLMDHLKVCHGLLVVPGPNFENHWYRFTETLTK